MDRGPASLLAAEDTHDLELMRPGPVRRLLAGFRDSCALVGVALLGCLALVAVGTVGSIAWMFLGNL